MRRNSYTVSVEVPNSLRKKFRTIYVESICGIFSKFILQKYNISYKTSYLFLNYCICDCDHLRCFKLRVEWKVSQIISFSQVSLTDL